MVKYDIVIIGAGLVGGALMLALQHSGFKTLLIDKKPLSTTINPVFDARALALSPASIHILESLGLWDTAQLQATPIHHIHVSEKGQWGRTRFDSKNNTPLGYIVEMPVIKAIIDTRLKNDTFRQGDVIAIDPKTPTLSIVCNNKTEIIHTSLIVIADGSDSPIRQLLDLDVRIKDYNTQALVTNIGLARSHQEWAYERFTDQGPLALLPMTNHRMSLVWSLNPKDNAQLMALADADFLKMLQTTFGYRTGAFTQVGHRVSYPLRQMIMPKPIKWPYVFIGNAAHTLHPVAGQGFNLGLRGAALLAESLIKKGITPDALTMYAKQQADDVRYTYAFTQTLAEIFVKKGPGFGIGRGLLLSLLDAAPHLKNTFKRQASGFAGTSSALASRITLSEILKDEPFC